MKKINDFPLYFISENGEVFSSIKNRKLKPFLCKHYLFVKLKNENGVFNKSIHRLLADNFIEKIEGKTHVDHIDRNTLNNSIDNLRWVNRSENMLNRYYNKRVLQTSKAGVVIGEFKNAREAFLETRICNISSCLLGNRAFAGKYKWSYKI